MTGFRCARVVRDPQSGQPRLGRFGYKANQPRLVHQIAGALNSDMGVTTSIFPQLDRGPSQNEVPSAVELADADLDKMFRYVATLGVAARRDLDDVLRSEAKRCSSPPAS